VGQAFPQREITPFLTFPQGGRDKKLPCPRSKRNLRSRIKPFPPGGNGKGGETGKRVR